MMRMKTLVTKMMVIMAKLWDLKQQAEMIVTFPTNTRIKPMIHAPVKITPGHGKFSCSRKDHGWPR